MITEELTEGDEVQVARVAAAAFTDDPYWLALAPMPALWRRTLIADLMRHDLRTGRLAGDGLLVVRRGQAIVGLARVAEERAHDVPASPPRAIRGTGPLGVRRWRRAEAQLAAVLPSDPHDYLYTIAVHPGHQGHGYGRVLLERVIARSRARGMPLLLDTMDPANVAFYERFGFTAIGTYPLARGYRAWAMRRE